MKIPSRREAGSAWEEREIGVKMPACAEGEKSLSYPLLQIPFIDGEQEFVVEDCEKCLGKEELSTIKEKGGLEDNIASEQTENTIEEIEKEREEVERVGKISENPEEEENEIVIQERGQDNGKQLTIAADVDKDKVALNDNVDKDEDETVAALKQQRNIPRVETWSISSTRKSPLHRSSKTCSPSVSSAVSSTVSLSVPSSVSSSVLSVVSLSVSSSVSLGKLSAGSKIGKSSSSPRLREQNR